MDLFYINVYLTIVAVESNSEEKDQNKFLVIEENSQIILPNTRLDRCSTTKDIAVRLMKDYSGITEHWAMLLPFGLIDDVNTKKDSISVLYGVFIPEVTRIRVPNTSWKTYSEINNSDKASPLTKKLMYEAIWRHI